MLKYKNSRQVPWRLNCNNWQKNISCLSTNYSSPSINKIIFSMQLYKQLFHDPILNLRPDDSGLVNLSIR